MNLKIFCALGVIAAVGLASASEGHEHLATQTYETFGSPAGNSNNNATIGWPHQVAEGRENYQRFLRPPYWGNNRSYPALEGITFPHEP